MADRDLGLVFVLEAADAMCKAADVDLIGGERGLRLYFRAGARCGAQNLQTGGGWREGSGRTWSGGLQLVVIPRPHPVLEKIINRQPGSSAAQARHEAAVGNRRSL